eukprot:6172091-Pleurochrysis_carterae.AAC.1
MIRVQYTLTPVLTPRKLQLPFVLSIFVTVISFIILLAAWGGAGERRAVWVTLFTGWAAFLSYG